MPGTRGLAIAALLWCAACRITDQQVDAEIERRHGTPLTASTPPIVLDGDVPITVSHSAERASILVQTGPPPACPDACWETVSREYLDGNPVMDPGTYPAAHQTKIAPELNRRAQNGYVPDVTDANPSGQKDDGACDAIKRHRSDYLDAPSFPDEYFDKGGRYRVYVLEQETCLRCLPKTTYVGCVKWYYVKVRNGEVDGHAVAPTIRVITTGTVQPAPSPEFRAAIDAWNRPP